MARILDQVTRFHPMPEEKEYARENGYLTISIWTLPHFELPRGRQWINHLIYTYAMQYYLLPCWDTACR